MFRFLKKRKARFEPSRLPAPVTEPIYIDDQVVDSWMAAANRRPNQTWEEIDHLLKELALVKPCRVWALRRDLRWLRHEAALRDYSWGVR